MPYHEMSADYAQGLNTANLVLTVAFTVEMVAKLFGMGFATYADDRANLFDGFIVITSLAEIVLEAGNLIAR